MESPSRALSERIIAADSLPNPHGWIQWKGTNVCMDVHCACGAHGHVDADFFYHYRCAACGRAYAVGASVRLWPLTEEEAQVVEREGNGFQRDDDLEPLAVGQSVRVKWKIRDGPPEQAICQVTSVDDGKVAVKYNGGWHWLDRENLVPL